MSMEEAIKDVSGSLPSREELSKLLCPKCGEDNLDIKFSPHKDRVGLRKYCKDPSNPNRTDICSSYLPDNCIQGAHFHIKCKCDFMWATV